MDKLTEVYYELTGEELARVEEIGDVDRYEGISYEELVCEACEYVKRKAETGNP